MIEKEKFELVATKNQLYVAASSKISITNLIDIGIFLNFDF